MVKNGMVSFVKRHINVQETESGIPHLIAVYAKITTTGVVMHAFQFHHAKVANFGIQFWWNVFAVQMLFGMAQTVFSVKMDKFGILQHLNVFALLGQLLFQENVKFNSNVQGAWCLCKTP